MGHHNSDQSTSLLAASQAANAQAAKPDPLEELQRQHAQALDDWEYGKSGPVDVRKMPGSDVGMSLFNDAKTAHDAGRVGKGLALTENPNTEFATGLDKENQLVRDTNASGELENYVSDKLAAKDAKLYGLAQMGNARNSSAADRAAALWQAYINRPQRPSFLKQFALGALGSFGSIGSAFAGAGGGGGHGSPSPNGIANSYGY